MNGEEWENDKKIYEDKRVSLQIVCSKLLGRKDQWRWEMVEQSKLGGRFGNLFCGFECPQNRNWICMPYQYCGEMVLPFLNHGRHGFCWSLIRFFSSQPSWHRKHNFGIAFDIDGVLLRGSKPIDGATRALRQLYWDAVKPSQMKIPFVFLTNGGGVSETIKASDLSEQFGVKIIPQQVLLGHTPFKTLVNCFQNEWILAVGKGEPANVMTEYGFRNVLSMDDYAWQFEEIDPLAKYKHWAKPPPAVNGHGISPSFMEKNMNPHQIDAVFIVSDPVDWGRDIQVLCDVLRSGGLPGRLSGRQPPLFFAADDFEYQAAFPVQRFGMGAFRIALENIYNRLESLGFPF
eukprot:c20299_g1_i1 orf=494-1531(-)